jgi:hypothetical protein
MNWPACRSRRNCSRSLLLPNFAIVAARRGQHDPKLREVPWLRLDIDRVSVLLDLSDRRRFRSKDWFKVTVMFGCEDEIVGNLRLASVGFHRTANASLYCFCLIATRIQHFVGREFWRINRQQKSLEREPCDDSLFRRVAGRGRWRSWWRKRSRSWAQDVDCRMPFWMRQSQQPLASELLHFCFGS